LNEQAPITTAQDDRLRGSAGRRSDALAPEVGKDEDFASPIASRGRMQLWLTAFTVFAALAVLAVVSMAVMQGG
jgi:hypothetical protein